MKFLRGKVWQILLAVVALVAVLCITASAEDPGSASFKIGTNTYTVNQDDENALYFRTNESGVATQLTGEIEEMENTYHIKAVFPKDDGETEGVPTIYLRGAYLTQGITSVSNTATLARIVVEDVDGFDVVVDEDTTANAYMTATITWTHSDVEIQGSGKLYTTGRINAEGKTVTFKDSDVKQRTTTTTGLSFDTLVFDGGKFDYRSDKAICSYWSGNPKTIWVKGNADVSIVSNQQSAIIIASANPSLIIDSGHLKAASYGVYDPDARDENGSNPTDGFGRVLRVPLSVNFKVNGGTLELIGNGGTVYSNNTPIDLSGYTSPYVTGTDTLTGENPRVITVTKLSEYYENSFKLLYLKIQPKFTVVAEGGTASVSSAIEGAEVTLQAKPASNQTFAGWTVVDCPEGFSIEDITDNGDLTATFNMPEGNVVVKANYITSATITFNQTTNGETPQTYTFHDNDESPLYFTTNSAGVVTEYDDENPEDNYHIKLVFVKGVPTMYLKTATISDRTNAVVIDSNVPQFDIVTEAASTITHTTDEVVDTPKSTGNSTRAAITFSGTLTFRGDELLTLKGANSSIFGVAANGANAHVRFEGTNVRLRTTGGRWAEANIAGKVGSVIVNGGVLDVVADSYMALWGITKMPVTVTGGAKVSIQANSRVTYYGVALDVDNGDVHIKSPIGDANTCLMGSTVSVRKDGTLEVETTATNGAVMPAKPEVAAGLHVVMGDSKATATPGIYADATTPNKKYIAIGKPVTVTVKDGTVKAFGTDPVVDVNDSTKQSVTAIVGVDVTVTANTPTAGKVFAWWTANANGKFADSNAATTTFTPVGEVTVTACFGKPAGVTIGSTALMTYQGLGATYLTTVDGNAVLGGDESTYNIKFVYPEGDDTVPVVYLRGAYLTQNLASNTNTIAGTEIVVEKVGNYPNTVPEGYNADSYATAVISWSGKDLVVKGYEGTKENPSLEELGKLKMETGSALFTMSSANRLTFKDLNLETANSAGYTFPSCEVVFDGGKCTTNSPNSAAYVVWASSTNHNTTSKGIVVTGGADVHLYGKGNVICLYYTDNANIVVDKDSRLKVESNSSQAIRAVQAETNNSYIWVNGGTLEVIGSGGNKAGYGTTVANLANYQNALNEKKYFVTADSKTESSESFTLSSYQYFKVEPAYAISARDGTAKVETDRVEVSDADRAPVGATVTLTALAKSGYEFTKWTYAENSAKPAITNNVFIMPAGAVSVEASYEKQATVILMGTSHTFIPSRTLYFKTDEAGAATQIDAPQDGKYNIKLAVVNDVPTVFLKDATLIANSNSVIPLRNGTNISNFVIVTESKSTIKGSGRAIYVDRADLTFGGTGKLSIIGNNNGTGSWGGASAIYLYQYHRDNDAAEDCVLRTIILDEGSDVYIKSNGASTGGIWVEYGLIKDGSDTTGNTNCHMDVKNGSKLEIESESNIIYPDIQNFTFAEDYEDWAIALGDSKETAVGFTGNETIRSQKYFKLAPGYEVVFADGGQATGLSNGNRAPAGVTISLSSSGAGVTVPENYAFYQWAIAEDSPNKPALSGNKFVMPEGNVKISATFQEKVIIKLRGGYTYTILEHTPSYFKTVDGALVSCEEGEYNIKFVFVDGVPAMFMKNAHISVTSGTNYVFSNNGHTELMIVVQADSSMTSTGRCLDLAHCDLTIRGPGKLSLIALNDGADVYSSGAPIYMVTGGTQRTLTLENGAGLYVTSSSPTAYSFYTDGNSATAKVVMKSGSLEVQHSSRVSYPGVILDLSQHETWAAMSTTTKNETVVHKTLTGLDTQKYVKIAPGKDVTVVDGTANTPRAFEGMDVTVTPNIPEEGKGFAYWTSADVLGEEKYNESAYTFTMPDYAVSLKANFGNLAQVALKGELYDTVQGGKAHYYTVSDNVITENGDANNYQLAFAWADEVGAVPTLTLNNVTMGGTYWYGAVMNGPKTNDLLIKVRGVNTLENGNSGSVIQFTGNHLTLEGVYDEETGKYGTLNMSTSANVLMMKAPDATNHAAWEPWDATEEHTLTINDVNMNLTGKGTGVIRLEKRYDLTINGGEIILNAIAEPKLDQIDPYYGNTAIYADGTSVMTFENVDLTIRSNAGAIRNAGGDVTFIGGTLNIGTAEAPVRSAFDISNKLVFANATVEVFASAHVYGEEGSQSADGTYVPDLSGYNFDYAAVLAKSYDAFLADPEASVYTVGTDTRANRYFSIRPKEVKVQITWGAMSFTYDGATWNVDTMTWDGDWTPVEGETETEAGNMKANQINVENVGTETVNVSFEFRQGDSFNHADVSGEFVDGNNAAIVGEYKLVRTAETDAFLKLNSAAVASGGWENTVPLGTIVVTINALTPSQGSEA